MRKKDNTRKKKFDDIEDDVEDFDFDYNEYGIDINDLDKDGYNINGVDEYGINKDGLNINNIKGTREKHPNRKINWIKDDNDILYDQYGFEKMNLIKMVIIYMDLIKMG